MDLNALLPNVCIAALVDAFATDSLTAAERVPLSFELPRVREMTQRHPPIQPCCYPTFVLGHLYKPEGHGTGLLAEQTKWIAGSELRFVQ